MAYIGRDIQYGTINKQSFTANGSTTVFTLDQGVADANNLIVSIGGVVQEPNVAYTAVGTVLTFTTAPANAAVVWAVYLGTEEGTPESSSEKVTYQTGTANGTTTPLTLNKSVPTSSSIIVTLDGLVQKPEIEFTVDGTTLTFISAPSSGLSIVVYYLVTSNPMSSVPDGSITAAKLNSTGTWPAWNGSNLTNLTAANLTGTLPALDGSALTGMQGGFDTKTGSDPLITSNKELGHLWMNSTSGELFCCTSATTNNNAWTNVGEGTGDIGLDTDENTVLLVRSDTTNGSKTFVDLSSYGHALTPHADLTHQDAQQKMGSTSIYSSNSAHHLEAAAHPAFNFGTGNWTVEYWVRPTGSSSNMWYFEIYNGISSGRNGFSVMREASTTARIFLDSYSSYTAFTMPSGWDDVNVWKHHALVRNGATISFYVDGVASSTTYNIGTNAMFSGGNPTIDMFSRASGSQSIMGYMDEFKVSNVARYTSNFTPSANFDYQ